MLEQYPVSSEVAAELLYLAGFEHRDLDGNIVDLGTGTGRLAIGAAIMGAKRVVGVDLDEKVIRLAKENAAASGVTVEWLVSDIDQITGEFDTVIMNPPYGTRSPHVDVDFLERAFQLGPVTYSIHKSSTRNYLRKVVERKNRRVDDLRCMTLNIPHLFSFHSKKWKRVEVDLYRIVS